MDIIKIKTKIYSQVVPLFVKYVEELSEAHTMMYEFVADMRNYLHKVETSVKFMESAKINTPENIFATIQNSNNVDNYLHYIYTSLNSSMEDMPSEMSNTFLLDMEKEFNNIVVKYSILVNDIGVNNSKLIHLVANKIKSCPLDIINKLFKHHRNTVNLYSHYIQNKLNTTDPHSEEYVSILDSLDMVKTLIINSANVVGKKSVCDDARIQRYGLVPVYQYLDNNQVLEQALNLLRQDDEKSSASKIKHGGYTPDKLKKMSDLFKEKKIGLYVIVNISSNQIEFDFKPLINRKASEKLQIGENSGLNKNIIFKYTNIKTIKGINEPDYKKLHLGDTESNRWLIIRTLNGTHYDIMSKEVDNIFVNRSFIKKLDRGPSLLVDTYQRISSNKIFSHCKIPREASLDLMTTPLQNMANKVIRQVSLYVDEKLNVAPVCLKEIFDIVSGSEIEDITSRIIIESYEDFSKDNNPELSSTFLYNADYVIKGFVKSVKERLSKSDLNEFMFKEKTKNSLVVHIRLSLINIIKVSAEKAFDPRKDIYEKLMVKKSLLNIEL